MQIRRAWIVLALVAVPGVRAQTPPAPTPPAPAPQTAPATPPQTPAPVVPAPPAASPASPAGTVVIDPGHGGTDAGARGATGILEKDVVISLAQVLRLVLERQGWRVVLTRSGSDNPGYDDRAATANAYRGAVVITLHASSTGTPGTARAYFSAPYPTGPAPSDENKVERREPTRPRPAGLVPWDEAQQSYRSASKRLADAVQANIKQRLEKSPSRAAPASLRDLRSIAAPAIAVELASVSVKDRKVLDVHLGPLAEAISKGVQAFRGDGVPAGAN